jgi:predicted nucleic acid-binding protein
VNYFFLDASAWIKRFHQEPGTDVVNRLVDRLLAIPQRLAISPLGLAEVIAALNRYRNEGRLPPLLCRQATARLLLEAKDMDAQPMSEAIVIESLTYISQHNLNASDALYLRQMFLLRRLLQRAGHDLVLVAADRRLLRAATTEGFVTLDPEAASISDVEVLVEADTDSEQDLSR